MSRRGRSDAELLDAGGRGAGPAKDGISLRRTQGEIILNWSGFLIGLLVMTGDYLTFPDRISPKEWGFLSSSRSKVWILLVSAQFAFWAGAIFPLWRSRAGITCSFGVHHPSQVRLKALLAIVFFAMPAYFFVRKIPDSGLAHHDSKLVVVNVVGAFVAITAGVGIWTVRAAIETRFDGRRPDEEGGRTSKEWAADILLLRKHLQGFIGLLGAMVGLGTLTKGALRQAFLATGGDPGQFPSDYVLIHGAYFSALLAMVYAPTHAVLAEVGTRLVDAVFPGDSPLLDLKKSAGWQADRKAMEDLLHLGTAATDDLRACLSILAPLASSVVAVWLGTKD
jgi:hypothetical protein